MNNLMKIILAFAFVFSALIAEAKKPNVLFVVSDQQVKKSLGCYGHPTQHTPNIDKLANEGIKLENAISTFPVCSPFRAMLFSGKYPFHNGMVKNSLVMFDDIKYMAHYFKEAGYLVGLSGKWHLWWAGEGEPTPEEFRGGFSDIWDLPFPENLRNPEGRKMLRERGEFDDKGGAFLAFPHSDNAIKMIDMSKEQDKPFLMVVSWNPPHPRYMAKKEEYDNKKSEDIIVSETYAMPAHLYPDGKAQWIHIQKDLPQDCLTNKEAFIEEALRHYYGACEGLDKEFARIMEHLEKSGMKDDTIIVYTSDHGDMLGAHGLLNKPYPYEEAINIPFIVRYPKKIKADTTTDVLIMPIDILPTLLDLADVKFDEKAFDGRSFAGSLEGKKDAYEHQAALIMSPDAWWRGVRTKTHTYVEHKGEPWLLFDNIKDPNQIDNLINLDDFADIQEDLKEKLIVLLEESGDEIYLKYAKNPKKYVEGLLGVFQDRLDKFEKDYPHIKTEHGNNSFVKKNK